MTDLRKAAEQALEALENIDRWLPTIGQRGLRDYEADAIQALRQALNVDAVNMSQERVDETAKDKHKWVGLDGEIPGLGLVTEEFYNGMLVAEDILREKNGG